MKQRAGFTLIEMMISITILSLLMVFLYKSYSQLNISNTQIQNAVAKLEHFQKIKTILYQDIAMANKITILSQDKDMDVVFMQTKHSLHARINPYVAYIMKNGSLYRLESLTPFTQYPLRVEDNFVVDKLLSIKGLRLYQNSKDKTLFVLHIALKNKKKILFKLKALNLK
jgi:prepilin-type N-terminal cleavage/methylation domain-containing protein